MTLSHPLQLRLDATPLAAPSFWDPAALCSEARARPDALHSMTDMAFWGGRDAARVAAMAWSGIGELFATTRADERPFSTTAMLQSMKVIPPSGTSPALEGWRFFNKFCAETNTKFRITRCEKPHVQLFAA